MSNSKIPVRPHHLAETAIRRLALVLVLIPGLLMCLPDVRAANDQSLEVWLRDEALPAVADRLGRHPRLKGMRVQVVAMQDNEIRAGTDGLSAYLRQRIVDHLRADPDVNLSQPLPVNPRRSGRLDARHCAEFLRPEVQVTVSAARAGEGVRVTLRAIDLVENTWVPGFQQVWSGRPAPVERERLARRVADEALMGTRELPYKAGEPDLLAAQLAHHVACRLLLAGRDDVSLHLPPPADASPAFLQRATALFARHLAEYSRLRLTPDASGARAEAVLKMLRIDGDLHQVWVEVAWRADADYVQGLDKPAYVRLDPAAVENARFAAAQFVKPELIASFHLIAPPDPALCRTPNPWSNGSRVVRPGQSLPSGGCFAIQYQPANAATRLYLFAQTEAGPLVRLLPDGCNALALAPEAADQGGLAHIPGQAGGGPGQFQLDQVPGTEWIYAVAVSNRTLGVEVLAQLAPARSLCEASATRVASPGVKEVRERLGRLQQAAAGRLEWRALHFLHEP